MRYILQMGYILQIGYKLQMGYILQMRYILQMGYILQMSIKSLKKEQHKQLIKFLVTVGPNVHIFDAGVSRIQKLH